MVVNCEQFANDAQTSLASPISLVDTNVTVVSITGFPISTPFRILIDDEIMMVVSISGNIFGVTREIEGTTAETHDVGAAVIQVFTNNSFFGFNECAFGTGIINDLPAPGLDGRIFLTQYPGWYLFREDGTHWITWGPIFQLNDGIDIEDDTWSWINPNDGVNPIVGLTDWYGDLNFYVAPNAVSGENIRLYTESVDNESPTAPPYTITIAFTPLLAPVNQTCCGLIFMDSVSGKFVIFRLMYDDSSVPKRDLVMSLDKYDDPNTFDSNYSVLSAGTLTAPMVWFQMEDDGINLSWYFSNDGANFSLFDIRSRTDFLPSGPDTVGIAFGTNNTTGDAGMILNSWLKV